MLIRLLLLLSGIVFATSGAAAQPRAGVEALAWLAGCWASEGGERGSGEQWMAPAGGSLLGMARTVRQGRTVAYEFLRISETPEGSLALVAQPSGQAEATFALVNAEATAVVFENPGHDFPQRIGYRLRADGTLLAFAEGGRDGGTQPPGETARLRFPMVPVPCGAGP